MTLNKKLIFDLDGTLFDTLQDIVVSVQKTFDALQFETPDSKEIRKSIGWGSRELFLRLLGPNSRLVDTALCNFEHIYLNNIAKITVPYPGVTKLLKKLKNDYSLIILTNKPRRFTHALLEHFDFCSFFDSVITPEDVSNIKKPDARLCSLDILKNAVFFVGDSEVDIEMAGKCKIPSVFVTYGYGNLNHLKPDFIIDTFSDLEAIVRDRK